MIAASRLSVVGAAQQANEDCDGDNYVEPLPWDGPVGAAPAGGGNLPASVGASRMDPWGTNYGYCAWDHGTAIDAAACGGASQKRLRGENADNKAMLAVISAGPDRVFQTKCADSPAYITKPAGSDDIVQQYTYAESQGIAGGLWTVKPGDLKTAEIDRNLEVKNGSNNVVMAFDQTTDTSKPSLKVDFLSKLTGAKKGVEMLSNIVLGSNWLSGDGDAEGIRIDSAGNVGIGTASPQVKLHIAGSPQTKLRVDTDGTGSDPYSELQFGRQGDGAYNWAVGAFDRNHPSASKPPVLTLDISLYEKYLEGSDMTDDQKREFLEALWSIVIGFVDLGFGIHPVQQAMESDGGELILREG